MSKLANKTLQYSVYDRTSGSAKYVEDTTKYKRPSIENLTDTLKGAGIMGEIDLPTLGQIGSMEIEITFNKTNAKAVALLSPETHTIEVRWVNDSFDSKTGGVSIESNKEIIKYMTKTFENGEIESNSTNEATLTGEVLTYQYILNGKSVVEIDKLNNVYKINGKDYTANIIKGL